MTKRPRHRRFDLRQDLWRVVVVLAALLLLNLGFYLFLNLPRLRALGNLTTGRDAARRALAVTEKTCGMLRDAVATYDQESRRLEEFYNVRLGTQVERMTVIQKEIREIAAEFKVDPDSIDYNPSDIEGTNVTRFQITIPLVGGYPNLRQFVNRIETSQRLFVVDSIELAGSREGGQMLSLTIRMSTFFLTPEGERPAGRAGKART